VARIEKVLSGEVSGWRYALDVLGHAGLGAAYSLPAMVPGVLLDWPAWLTWSLAELLALTGGALRELVQFLKSDKPVADKLHLRDRLLDTLHHALGPPISLGLVHLVVFLAT